MRAGITLRFTNDLSSAWELSEVGSIYLCLYLGRSQGKSPHPNVRFVWEIRAGKGSNLRQRCSLDALQKRRMRPLLLMDGLNAFLDRRTSPYTNGTTTPIHAVLLSYAFFTLKTIFIW